MDSTIKSFVRRSNDKYGKLFQNYLQSIKKTSSNLSKKHVKGEIPKKPLTKLTNYDSEANALDNVIAGIFYEQSPSIPLQKILLNVKKMKKSEKNHIIESFSKLRKNRRHRPPRSFELVNYTFDLINNFGMFRDFHRHRALTLERQLLTTDHGYAMPKEITILGIDKEFKDCMYKSKEIFDQIRKKYPEQAQYVVNFAFNYPYFMHLNLREACHLIELRTVPQGHSDYRKVAQDMVNEIKRIHPNLSKIIRFADMKEYDLERFESEKRTEEKKRKY